MIQEGADEDLQQQLEALLSKEIAGIDEVGKGSLFGPVFAGAVILGINAEAELTNEG